MNRSYTSDAAASGIDPNYGILAQAKMQEAARQQNCANSLSPPTQTELESLLHTLRNQACEIRAIVTQISCRVVPQCEDECDAQQGFNSGYIGQAEEVRSIQNEITRMLVELSKYA